LTNTYFKKSRKEEKLRILKRDLIKSFEYAKNNHKKNKSENDFNSHFRGFSLFDENNKN